MSKESHIVTFDLLDFLLLTNSGSSDASVDTPFKYWRWKLALLMFLLKKNPFCFHSSNIKMNSFSGPVPVFKNELVIFLIPIKRNLLLLKLFFLFLSFLNNFRFYKFMNGWKTKIKNKNGPWTKAKPLQLSQNFTITRGISISLNALNCMYRQKIYNHSFCQFYA